MPAKCGHFSAVTDKSVLEQIAGDMGSKAGIAVAVLLVGHPKDGTDGVKAMTAEELWRRSGIDGKYDAWAFGDDADRLAELVRSGIKTATSSLKCFYELEDEPLPQPGEYNIILDSNDEAICVIRTTKVYTVPFDQVTEEHACREGEGDRTLEYWRRVHWEFFSEELKDIGKSFEEGMEIVCEEFETIFPRKLSE